MARTWRQVKKWKGNRSIKCNHDRARKAKAPHIFSAKAAFALGAMFWHRGQISSSTNARGPMHGSCIGYSELPDAIGLSRLAFSCSYARNNFPGAEKFEFKFGGVMANIGDFFHVNDRVPVSGIYRVIHHPPHADEHCVTCICGETFPHCLGCESPQFELRRDATYIMANENFSVKFVTGRRRYEARRATAEMSPYDQ